MALYKLNVWIKGNKLKTIFDSADSVYMVNLFPSKVVVSFDFHTLQFYKIKIHFFAFMAEKISRKNKEVILY